MARLELPPRVIHSEIALRGNWTIDVYGIVYERAKFFDFIFWARRKLWWKWKNNTGDIGI